MPEEISFEFDDFCLNPVRRLLLRNETSVQLPTKALDLLLELVRGKGSPFSKELLAKEVWGTTSVSDNTFHVTLHAVRKALGDSAERQRYIRKVSRGYCFVADVREVPANIPRSNVEELDLKIEQHVLSEQVSGQDARAPRGASSRHLAHLFVSCSIYAALYAVSLFLEIAYEFDRFGDLAWKIVPFVFVWIAISSIGGLELDRKLTSQGKASGLAASSATFLIAAAVLFAALTQFLPSFPITQSTALQTYPAQAAYLKDIAYFVILAFCFLIVPFHFIATVERDIERGHCDQILGLLSGNKLSASPRGTIYPRFWALASLLVVLAAFSLVMTSRLLDHLKPGPHMNLFTQLVYLRGILYFGLGIECLIWYYRAIEEIKRECLGSPVGKQFGVSPMKQ